MIHSLTLVARSARVDVSGQRGLQPGTLGPPLRRGLGDCVIDPAPGTGEQ
jgi:hypothetical protein